LGLTPRKATGTAGGEQSQVVIGSSKEQGGREILEKDGRRHFHKLAEERKTSKGNKEVFKKTSWLYVNKEKGRGGRLVLEKKKKSPKKDEEW